MSPIPCILGLPPPSLRSVIEQIGSLAETAIAETMRRLSVAARAFANCFHQLTSLGGIATPDELYADPRHRDLVDPWPDYPPGVDFQVAAAKAGRPIWQALLLASPSFGE